MNLKHIKKVQEVLTNWNPLGEQAIQVSDLNEYETEATDIVFHVGTEIHFKRTKDPKSRVQIIIKNVLEEAFNLHLSEAECKIPSEDIFRILN